MLTTLPSAYRAVYISMEWLRYTSVHLTTVLIVTKFIIVCIMFSLVIKQRSFEPLVCFDLFPWTLADISVFDFFAFYKYWTLTLSYTYYIWRATFLVCRCPNVFSFLSFLFCEPVHHNEIAPGGIITVLLNWMELKNTNIAQSPPFQNNHPSVLLFLSAINHTVEVFHRRHPLLTPLYIAPKAAVDWLID